MKKSEKKETEQKFLSHKEALERMKKRQKIFANYLQVCVDPKNAIENYTNYINIKGGSV